MWVLAFESLDGCEIDLRGNLTLQITIEVPC